MAQARDVLIPSGLRYLHLKKSFQLSIRTLLTSCSREDIDRAFPTLTHDEQEILYHSFVQVISSLHEGINAEFESFCQDTQVGTILDTVEEQLEEQNLDTLFTESAKAEIGDVKKKLSDVKKEEIYFLTTLLGKLQDKNNAMRTRIAALKDQQPQPVDVGKLKGWTLNDEDFQKPREGYF